MASQYHHHLPHHCQHQPPPPTTTATHCCCNPSYSCCCPPPPSIDQLSQAIASLLSQSDPFPTHFYTHYPKFQTHKLLNQDYQKYHPTHCLHQQQEQQIHFIIASILGRIESLESSLHHFSSHGYHSSYSLRDVAARIIQTHFRAFLVRGSRTLRQLKELAFIKSSFNSLKSSFSNETRLDFSALSHKAMDLLLKLDSIQGGDPTIRDRKRSISRDLVQFLDFIDGVAVKKHLRCLKATKNARFGQNTSKSRVLDSKYGNLGDDQKKLLENLRGRVERISRLCKFSANDEEDVESEGIYHVADYDGDSTVLTSRRNGVTTTKNGVFVQWHKVQPKVKKSVSFAESGKILKVYKNNYEPALSGDVTYLDGSSYSDDHGEVSENISSEVVDVFGSSHRAEEDEEAVLDNGGSSQRSGGERNYCRDPKNDSRIEMLQEQKEKIVFSAPLPLKMESRADLIKSKGVRIAT